MVRCAPAASASFESSMTPETGFTSRFVSASDGLKLHLRDYGSLAATALPVILSLIHISWCRTRLSRLPT